MRGRATRPGRHRYPHENRRGEEIREGERRVALVPESCAKLAKAGFTVAVEGGAGNGAFFPDDAFREAGAGNRERPGGALIGRRPRPEGAAPDVQPDRRAARGVHDAARRRARGPARSRASSRRGGAACGRGSPRSPRTGSPHHARPADGHPLLDGQHRRLQGGADRREPPPALLPMLSTAAGNDPPGEGLRHRRGRGGAAGGRHGAAPGRRRGGHRHAVRGPGAGAEPGSPLRRRRNRESAEDAGGYARELSPEFYRKQAELIAGRCAHRTSSSRRR